MSTISIIEETEKTVKIVKTTTLPDGSKLTETAYIRSVETKDITPIPTVPLATRVHNALETAREIIGLGFESGAFLTGISTIVSIIIMSTPFVLIYHTVLTLQHDAPSIHDKNFTRKALASAGRMMRRVVTDVARGVFFVIPIVGAAVLITDRVHDNLMYSIKRKLTADLFC